MPHSLAEAQASVRVFYNQSDRGEPVKELTTMCMVALKQSDADLHALLEEAKAQHWAVVLLYHNITAIHTLAFNMFGDDAAAFAQREHVPPKEDGFWAAAREKVETLAFLHEVIDENGKGKARALQVTRQFGTRDKLCEGTYHEFSKKLGHMGILSDSDMHNVLTGVRASHHTSPAVRHELWMAEVDQHLADTLEKWNVQSVKDLTPEQYDRLRHDHITHKAQRDALARLYAGDEGVDGAAERTAANTVLLEKLRDAAADAAALRAAGDPSEADRSVLCDRIRELDVGSAPLLAASTGRLDKLCHQLAVLEAALKEAVALRAPKDLGTLLTNISEGMAQRGVFVKGERQPARMFLSPERFVDRAPPPEMTVRLDDRQFTEEEWGKYKRANEEVGPGFAMDISNSPPPEGTFGGVQTSRLTMRLGAFHRATVDMVMSDEAIRDACAVTDVEKGKAYMEQYGSHVPCGEHTVGAELTRVAIATSSDRNVSMDSLLAQADSMMSWGPAESGARFERGREKTQMPVGNGICTVWTEAISRGPNEAKPSEFLQKLHDASTWCLLDRGDAAQMEPVWSIMARSKDLLVRQAAPHVRDAWIEMVSRLPGRLPLWIHELHARAQNEASGVGTAAPSTVEDSASKLSHDLRCLFVAEHDHRSDAARACNMADHLAEVFDMVGRADRAGTSHTDFFMRMLDDSALQVWIRAAARSIGPISHHRGAVARALQAMLTPEFRKEALARNCTRVTELLQEEAVHELLEWSVEEEEESCVSAPEHAPHVLYTHDELCSEVRKIASDNQTPLDRCITQLGALLSHNVRETTIDMLGDKEKLMRIEVRKVLVKTYTLMMDGFHSPLSSRSELQILSGDLANISLPTGNDVDVAVGNIRPTGHALSGGVYANDDWAERVKPPTSIKYRVDRIPATAGGAAMCDALLRRLPLTAPVEEPGESSEQDEEAAARRLLEYMRVCGVPRQFQEAAMQVLGVGGPGRHSPARAP